jgi:hypothetical protein
MRSWALWIAVCSLTAFSRGEGTQSLENAIAKVVNDQDCWAYTQVIRRLDKKEGETISTYDPSKPFAERWSLLQWKGRPPTPVERDRWLKRRQNERKQSSFIGLLDISNAKQVGRDGEVDVFEVPLKKEMIKNLVPTDKFVAHVGVDRDRETVEEFSLRTRESFRIAGIGEVDSAEGEVVFKHIDERYVPQPALVRTSGTGRALFVKVDRSMEISFLDHRRVVPAQAGR